MEELRQGDSGNHPNIWQAQGADNSVFHHNEITEWLAEGIMLDFSSALDTADQRTQDLLEPMATKPGQLARVLTTQYVQQSNILLYGNTVVNCHYGILDEGGTWASSCSSQNNIFMNLVGGFTGFRQGLDDYNLSNMTIDGAHSISGAATNVFTNYAGQLYTISEVIGAKYPRDKGATLGSPYNLDYAGNTRTAPYAIGAYEYVAGPPLILGQGSQAGSIFAGF